MGWVKEAGVVYKSVKKSDDDNLEVVLDDSSSNRDEAWPRRHLSQDYYHRLKHYVLYSGLTLLTIILQSNYLAYKFYLYYSHPDELLQMPWLISLLLCECAYLVSSVLSAFDHLLPPSTRPDLGVLDTAQTKCPTVDIFIPTCKEHTDILVESVKAARAIDYPQHLVKVFVLDDGGDDDLRAFCDDAVNVETNGGEKRLVYIRREKRPGEAHNFKCGNINNGLAHSRAEYAVMMDADMILHPSYLRRSLPHIVNSSNVSFVQIPQAFYNLAIGDPLNDSCVMSYHRMLPNRGSMGMVACIGTGTLFRRKHLDEIGGFQPQSITEDTMTAYTLFNRGYKSVYVNEKLQIGLTPWTFEGYVKQRTRWGKGAIQQWAATWRACLGRDSQLNLVQKAHYFYHTGFYFVSFVNVLLVGTLMGALAFNAKLAVGTQAENLTLIKYLTFYLLSLRIAWFALWLDLPQGNMMRNREESQFWWMTPYFLQMCLQSICDFKATFDFVPSSNVDRNAAAVWASQSGLIPSWMSKYGIVKWHLGFVAIAIAVVTSRVSQVLNVDTDCGETLLALGLSFFLVTVSAHMLIPVAFICFSPNFKPADRQSLIRLNVSGVPLFDPTDGVPQWSWTVLPYEILSWLTLLILAAILVFVIRNPFGNVLQS